MVVLSNGEEGVAMMVVMTMMMTVMRDDDGDDDHDEDKKHAVYGSGVDSVFTMRRMVVQMEA